MVHSTIWAAAANSSWMMSMMTWTARWSRAAVSSQFSPAPPKQAVACPRWPITVRAMLVALCNISRRTLRRVIRGADSSSTLTVRRCATSRSRARRTRASCWQVGPRSPTRDALCSGAGVTWRASRTISISISTSRWPRMASRVEWDITTTSRRPTCRRHSSRQTSLKARMRAPTTLSATCRQTQSVGPTLSSFSRII